MHVILHDQGGVNNIPLI